MKTTITPAERLQLVGLATIGRQHAAKADEAGDAMKELLGTETDDSGHISDVIWADRDVDWMLRGLKVKVEPAKRKGSNVFKRK